MTRRKLLHRMKEVCGATRHMMDDGLIVEEHQVDGTRLLIFIYIHIYTYMYKLFCHTCVTSKMLLQPVPSVTMYWTKFLYDQIVVFLLYIIILRVIILFYFLCQ